MSTTVKILKYELQDVARSRWLTGYALFFLALTDALLRFSDTGAKAALSLMSVVLFVIPLVSIVFGTIYLYNAREFTELMLAQPVGRRQIFAGLYLGLALPLSGAFAAGLGLPFVYHGVDDSVQPGSLLALGAAGIALTWVFLALALLIAVRAEDRVRGLGVAISAWLFAALLYDGVVLLVATVFSEYPIERPMLALTLANPVDLARVALLLRFDAGAMMGYTGAVFEKFFGSTDGTALSLGVLALWLTVPLALSLKHFLRKDF